MPTKIINALNAGEISPQLYGRTDLSKYFSAVQTMENFIPRPYGGAELASGTEYIAEVKDSTARVRLIPFIFNTSTSYIIEMGNLYMRFYRAGAQLAVSPEIVTPYTTAQLRDVKFVQSADVMYLVHESHEPQKLSRTSDTAWTLAEVAFTNGPFLDENTTATTMQISFPVWATATVYAVDDTVRISEATKTVRAGLNLDANAIVDNGDGTVQIDVGAGSHTFVAGDYISIAGTDNYDGDHIIVSVTGTTSIKITATYVIETPDASETCRYRPKDLGSGTVGFYVDAHGYSTDDIVTIAGTTNYNGDYAVHSDSSTNQVVIVAAWVTEELDATETFSKQAFYNAITAHTSGAGNPTPPGNITDWVTATKFTGTYSSAVYEPILTASATTFTASHVGALWKLTHPIKQVGFSVNFDTTAGTSATFNVKKGAWTMITGGTTGNGANTITLERSIDNGATWDQIRQYTRAHNVSTTGEELEDGAIYRLIYVRNGGTCSVDFNQDIYETDGIFQVKEFVSGTSVRGSIIQAIETVTSTAKWCEGAWSDERGWPETVTFFEERLMFGGNTANPITVWGSKSGDYENMQAGVLDDDAIIYTLNAGRINRIQWLEPQEFLLIGIAGSIWRLGSNDRDDPLTPTNVIARRQTTDRCSSVAAQPVNDTILFLEKSGLKLRELAYSIDKDGYISPDMTILADHITDSGIVEMAYQQHRDSILWCVRTDGTVVAFTYERNEEVTAWHRHTTDGTFESVAVIPNDTELNEDEVYFAVNRSINGATKRYIERKKAQKFDTIDECWYLDSALETDAGAAVTITNITNANPASVASTAHGLATGNHVRIQGVTGMTKANDIFEVVKVDANNYTLKTADGTTAINSSDWVAFASSTAPTIDNDSAVNKQLGLVGIPAANHYLTAGQFILIAGSINYDDTYIVRSETTVNEVVIKAVYKPEKFLGTETMTTQITGEKVAKTFTGLTHLNAKEVAINGDGATQARKTVSSGSVTFDTFVNRAIVGLPRRSLIKTLRFESGNQSQGRKKRINRLIARIYNSQVFQYGPDENTLYSAELNSEETELDEFLNLYTGDAILDFPGSVDREGYITIVQDLPLPLTVTSLVADFKETGV
jgi:hypothetical protein